MSTDELALSPGPVTRLKSKKLKKTMQGFIKLHVEVLQVHFEVKEQLSHYSIPRPNALFEDSNFVTFSVSLTTTLDCYLYYLR